MYKERYLKNNYQKKIFKRSSIILEKKHMVGLDVFTSGGKSPISAELINYLMENYGCKNVLVISSEPTWEALSSKYELIGFPMENVHHIKNVVLSRGKSLMDAIDNCGIDPSDVDVILFDECHKLFGDNIHAELEKNKDYIYSKYVIAMTATRINGIKMIDSLNELVGNKNIVTYSLNDAVSNDIIDPINMVNVSLRCAPEYYEYISELLDEKSCRINEKLLSKLIEDTRDIIKKKSIDTVENVIYSNIIDGAKRCKINLDASQGARVIIFFNRIEDIEKTEEGLKEALQKVYEGCNINYIAYTSKSSEDEVNRAVEVLTSDESTPNQVDVIATCDMAAESFHPVNVQLGLIFGGTMSIRKELQRVGRFITLKQYKNCDCIIFDFSESFNKLGDRNIMRGKLELGIRSSEVIKLSRYFNDKQSDISELLCEYAGSINIISSSIDNDIIDKLDRVEALVNVMDGNDDLIKYIDDNIEAIMDRKTYFGNIAKFLRDREKDTKVVKDNNFYNRYETIRKYMLYPMLNDKDRELLKKSFGKYGVSNYLGAGISADNMSYTKMLYRSINSDKFNIDKYWKDYITKNMTSECAMMIRQNSTILEQVNQRFLDSKPTQFGVSNYARLKIKIEIYLTAIKQIDSVSGNDLRRTNKIITILYKYFEVLYAEKGISNSIRNYIGSLMILANDLNIKLCKLNRSDTNAIKYLSALDIVRNKPDAKMNNSKVEEYILGVNTSRLSETEKLTIFMCNAGTDGTVDDFVDQCVTLTRAYRLSNAASLSKRCSDLIKLKKFVDNGGIIPLWIQKEFNVKELLDRATKFEKVKMDYNIVNRQSTIVTPLQLVELVVEDDKVYHDIQSLVFIRDGKISDENHSNYSRILGNIKRNVERDKMTTLRNISGYSFIKNSASVESVLADISR